RLAGRHSGWRVSLDAAARDDSRRSALPGSPGPNKLTMPYFRFHLSFRDVQDLLAERGLIVSHETVRQWCTKFGATFAAGLRRRRARAGDKWQLDQVALKIRGKRHWLWRAVDQNGVVLDILIQERRDQAAAERFSTSGA